MADKNKPVVEDDDDDEAERLAVKIDNLNCGFVVFVSHLSCAKSVPRFYFVNWLFYCLLHYVF